MRAVVVGHATLDVSGAGLVPGGSAWYAARALAALGCEVRLLTAAGPELPGDALRADGAVGTLEARVVACDRTTVFENVHSPDGRRRQRVRAAAPPLEPGALPAAWRGADLLLLAPVLGEIAPAAFVRAAAARRAGLCVQGLVREVRPGGEVVPRPLDPGALAAAGLDVAFLGEDEEAGAPGLAAAIAAAVPVAVLTRGARGSEVRTEGRVLHAGIHPAREVDPTGAGDVYAAAFLLALAGGGSLEDAARLGAAAASIVVEGRGGAALPRMREAWARAAAVPLG